jgi:hypothetical protein
MFRVMAMTGSRVKELPEAYPDHDSPEFQELCEAMGLGFPDNRFERYIMWLEVSAAKEGEDIKMLNDKFLNFAGLSPEDIAEAMERFRSDEERSEDLATPDPSPSRNGDQDIRSPSTVS